MVEIPVAQHILSECNTQLLPNFTSIFSTPISYPWQQIAVDTQLALFQCIVVFTSMEISAWDR